MANIQDVARLAGVSPTTAKRALREPDKLTPETLARVQQAIAQLHYEPDQRAGSLRGGQSRTVGLVVGSIVEPFFAQFARTAGRTLQAAGYTLIISENEYSARLELQELSRLYGQRVAAILVRPGYGPDSREYLQRLRDRGLFVLEYDYRPPGSPFPSVMLDNAACMREAVAYLHGLGHTRIAALGTFDPEIHPEERSRTFPEAMRERGLTVPAAYQRVTLLTEDTAYTLTHELLGLPDPPTALIALTGTQAIGAFRAIRERGLRLPDDLSLLTFDNYPWTALVDPPITVIEQPVEAMAEAAAQAVLRALEDGDFRTDHQVMRGRLIVRGSCAPLRSSEMVAAGRAPLAP
ncbi:LacI family transcriptional regulator (plasmid) [Deinococcus metallilatus]|uniref:LacI family transcriptional regulator n=1 Tax=Deinococcus metallilatus TaxID=1211322 RepID=A0AAJ5FCU1_9DEIO|nr:LacI family DNA-binding transcriptional regulator [Deinococcus metallilatus]MBB5297354.1 LacI family transcriptional regulator [Deinococcus metallilatus]QBY06923.1 LacI family transcriptional regulator [Deinococcus metallilatus]TLK32313.1 LacI family transcriptional regulator [Deinococcus metallilatus]GMA17059.1 LacI family transcriptional regulator [Deinococcus metallilatus]